jgi:hypothetical protein
VLAVRRAAIEREDPVLDAGGYVALALLFVELVLILFFVRKKILKAAFITVSFPIVFLAVYFWNGSRVTEITIPGVGTIKTAVDLATQYVQDIKNIKTEVEHQQQVIDVVALAAHATDRVITELGEKNTKAADQLRQVTEQLEQAKQLTHELQQQQEYSNVARYDAFGLLGLAGLGLREKSPLNTIFGTYVHNDPKEFRFDCTPEAVNAYTDAIKLESKFPFPYYYRGMCNQLNNIEGWQHDLDTARAIFAITTRRLIPLSQVGQYVV